ncbi:type II toxin-antitoxin system RelE/ParE family toxin [Paraflavitalea soli]|uniref:Type II toxin-antitoxin system RelE/ParE family toxin n=1 Tax=Paraflavitalea soli TaxID=2315862 RepID=A0A3B7MLF3_9BACT|nr:type II toxin-antitoxin system RelE/ParE family toxin [Paraflavitalea soli]AXY74527.1 type II toxin-antitoxin system RelE/ParE family toxin [Paraflavitalea soli]
MVAKKRRVIWDEEARDYFKETIAYIKKDSVQNAEKIKQEILLSTRELANEPEKLHAPDKYRVNNNGSYRAYELYHYRISYFTSPEYIRIVRMRHTSMKPEQY